jgi:spermidine synthase
MKQHIAKLPEHIQEIYYSQSMTNKHADTLREEAYYAPEDCRQLQECASTLADIPLIVVSAGKPFMSDDSAEHFYTPDQIKHVNEQWPLLQANLAKKSSRSVHIIAQESGHRIPIDQPEIIVDAVRQMIEQIS